MNLKQFNAAKKQRQPHDQSVELLDLLHGFGAGTDRERHGGLRRNNRFVHVDRAVRVHFAQDEGRFV